MDIYEVNETLGVLVGELTETWGKRLTPQQRAIKNKLRAKTNRKINKKFGRLGRKKFGAGRIAS